jgi:hypothetical protein
MDSKHGSMPPLRPQRIRELLIFESLVVSDRSSSGMLSNLAYVTGSGIPVSDLFNIERTGPRNEPVVHRKIRRDGA